MRKTSAVGVHIALEWSGLTYSAKLLRPGEQRSAQYLDLNPMAVVPTLVLDDDYRLTETTAILSYINCLVPNRFALSGSDIEKTKLNQTLSFISNEFYGAFRIYRSPAIIHPDHTEHSLLRAMACNRIERLAILLEERFQGPFLFGEQKSVADPYLYILLNWLSKTRIKLEAFAKLNAFHHQMNVDPDIRKVIASYGTNGSGDS